ncbi:MAG TPA: helix-turn-helix domain-containing protein [Anaerolineae bacterium]|nr:helix-turn-helix domain-containing protein [Anaerolineae bacterium]
MSEQSIYRPPQAVARELDVSPATLRRWSDEFANYLSSGADSGQGRSHRRYSERDVAVLAAIKELMNNGMTYEQVRQQLANHFTVAAESTLHLSPDDPTQDDFVNNEYLAEVNSNEESALVAANGAESPAIAFLTNTLMALSDSQKSILNSHAANRELMGVLIQDNFNLKEENNRLRERILEVERSAAQVRQEEEWRREALRQEMDAKIAAVQQLATEAITTANSVEVPDIKAINTKPGCLGALFGGGGTRIITMPRRRRQGQETHRAGPAPSPSQPPLSPQLPAAHPKPTAPPE